MTAPIRPERRLAAALLLSTLLWPAPPASAGQKPSRPQGYESWTSAGEALRLTGKDAEARAAFEKALSFPSRDFRAETALARLDEERGRWDEAAAHYLRARRKAPANYALCMQLAKAYGNMGRLDLARETYAQAKRLDPKQAQAYIREGYEDLHAGDAAGAETQFQDLIEIDTSSPSGYHHLASYFKYRGDLSSAERFLRKALELLAAQPRPYPPGRLFDVLHATCNLCDILRQQGRLDEAQALLRQALLMSPPPMWHAVILDQLALIDSRRGNRAEAEEYLKRAAALCPSAAACGHPALLTCAGPLIHLAGLYADEERSAQAREAADKAWSLYPAAERMRDVDFPAAVALGDLYLRLGEDAEAERAYRLLASQPRRKFPTELMGIAEARVAELCRKNGREWEAVDFYRDALRIARLRGQRARALRLSFALAWTWARGYLRPRR